MAKLEVSVAGQPTSGRERRMEIGEGSIGGGAKAGYSTRYRVGTSDCDTRRRPKGHPSSCPGGRSQLSGDWGRAKVGKHLREKRTK